MKKFIKVNLIILILITYMSMNSLILANENEEVVEESTDEEIQIGIFEKEDEEVEETELTEMDILRLEVEETEADIESFGNQIGVIQEELSLAVAEMAELNQTIYEKELEIQSLRVQQERILGLISETEALVEASDERYKNQKDLLF